MIRILLKIKKFYFNQPSFFSFNFSQLKSMKFYTNNKYQLTIIKSMIVFLVLIASTLTAILLTPKMNVVKRNPDFEKIIPFKFGDWQEIKDPFAQVSLSTDKNDLINQIYDRVLMRTYINSNGDKVMLAIAYALEQKQDVKIHRPEVCYVAQGFRIVSKAENKLVMKSLFKPIGAQELLMENGSRYEAVSYWIRIGNSYPKEGFSARFKILKEGLKGKILDGILVRSSIALNEGSGAGIAFEIQKKFLTDLVESVKPLERSLLVVE